MTWLILAIGAHLINAISLIATKVLTQKYINSTVVIAVVIGILGLGAFALSPLGLEWPGTSGFVFDLVAGILIIVAFLFFNYTLKNFEVSRVVPIVGGAIPAFTWMLSYLFLNEILTNKEIIAFIFLVIGTVIIANTGGTKAKFSFNLIIYSLGSAFFFAAAFVTSKYTFETQPFISSFIWTRLGSFVIVLAIILNKNYWRQLVEIKKQLSVKFFAVVFLAFGCGAIGYSLLNYVIATGSVTIANALQAVQYAFILAATVVVSKFWPKIIREKFSPSIVAMKILGIILVSAGIVFLSM